MQKIVSTFCLCILSSIVLSQNNKKPKDSINTEVINVITSYTPTISDAFKIKKNPKIKLSNKNQKKQLKYKIFSAPVVSVFTPKSGVLKGINVGPKERIYQNYFAAGYGNNATPFVETFLHHTTRFENDFGFYAKYLSSENSIDNSLLNSNFSNMNFDTYYQQRERYLRWKISAGYQKDMYNWYGLPSTISYLPTTINSINPKQSYNNLNLEADVVFEERYIKSIKANFYSFSDALSSKELRATLKPQFIISLENLGRRYNHLIVDSSIDYVNGEFDQSYNSTNKFEYSFFSVGVMPKYNFEYNDFTFKLGTKIYFTSDLENKLNQAFIYPDINISYPLATNHINAYLGVGGDLNTNTFKNFSSENPFLSPTQFITQTNKKYNFYVGFNGKISHNINYNLRTSYTNDEDKPLFFRNNSKSNGTNTAGLLGYEYGNSFSIVYDDIKTLNIFGEFSIEVHKNLTIGANGEFNSYTLTNQIEAWNLPTMNAEIFAHYKTPKWYTSINIFTVSERSDVSYSGIHPSTINGVETLNSYIDVNLNGGYHFNNQLSSFIKLNNITNSNYQRFDNFQVQGFQVLAGVSYKFDF